MAGCIHVGNAPWCAVVNTHTSVYLQPCCDDMSGRRKQPFSATWDTCDGMCISSTEFVVNDGFNHLFLGLNTRIHSKERNPWRTLQGCAPQWAVLWCFFLQRKTTKRAFGRALLRGNFLSNRSSAFTVVYLLCFGPNKHPLNWILFSKSAPKGHLVVEIAAWNIPLIPSSEKENSINYFHAQMPRGASTIFCHLKRPPEATQTGNFPTFV